MIELPHMSNVLKNAIKACVVFLCHDGKGNFLMSLRGEGSRDNHGLWDPGSGEILYGEKSAQALKRELLEEYNSIPKQYIFMGIRENINKENHWICFDYLVEVERNLVKNNEKNKLIKIEWFNYKQLPIKDSHPLFGEFLEKNKKIIEKIL